MFSAGLYPDPVGVSQTSSWISGVGRKEEGREEGRGRESAKEGRKLGSLQ